MKLTRKPNSKIKRYCIFISQETKEDGSVITIQDEIGDEELKAELERSLLEEIWQNYKK